MARGECPLCNTPNEYSEILCNMCGARLPWAEQVTASVPAESITPIAPIESPAARKSQSTNISHPGKALLRKAVAGGVLILILVVALRWMKTGRDNRPGPGTVFNIPSLLGKSPAQLQNELGPGLSADGDKTISGLARIAWTRGDVDLIAHYPTGSDKIDHFYLTTDDLWNGSEDKERTLALGNLKIDEATEKIYTVEFVRGMGAEHTGIEIFPSFR